MVMGAIVEFGFVLWIHFCMIVSKSTTMARGRINDDISERQMSSGRGWFVLIWLYGPCAWRLALTTKTDQDPARQKMVKYSIAEDPSASMKCGRNLASWGHLPSTSYIPKPGDARMQKISAKINFDIQAICES